MLLKSNGSDRLWITNRHGPGLLQNELYVGKLVWNKQRTRRIRPAARGSPG
jgi:hypothetical protein